MLFFFELDNDLDRNLSRNITKIKLHLNACSPMIRLVSNPLATLTAVLIRSRTAFPKKQALDLLLRTNPGAGLLVSL